MKIASAGNSDTAAYSALIANEQRGEDWKPTNLEVEKFTEFENEAFSKLD